MLCSGTLSFHPGLAMHNHMYVSAACVFTEGDPASGRVSWTRLTSCVDHAL